MRIGIALDNWKLNHFRNRLTAAGYDYENAGSAGKDVTLLRVTTDDLEGLAKVVRQCQLECAQMEKPS